MRPKRAPSSSAQSISLSVTAGVSPLWPRRTSSAAQTPSAAVEPAAVRHGVDVRADDDDLVALARDASPTGCRRRRARPRAERLELAEQPFARRPPVLAPRKPARPVRARRSAPPAHAGPRAVAPSRSRASATIKGTVPLGLRATRRAAGGSCVAWFAGGASSWSSLPCWRCSRRPRARAVAVRARDGRELRSRPAPGGRSRGASELPQGARRCSCASRCRRSRRRTPSWRKIDAAGFGAWITAPAGLGKYTYDKTVQDLLAPASYRAVVNFRWRDARGRTVRYRARGLAGLQAARLAPGPGRAQRARAGHRGRYVAVVFNRGREAAGAFDVDFLRDGAALGTATVAGLAPQTLVTVVLPGLPLRGRASRSRPSRTPAPTSTRPTRRTTRSACPAEPWGPGIRAYNSKNHED